MKALEITQYSGTIVSAYAKSKTTAGPIRCPRC